MKRSATTPDNVANKRAREDTTRYATDLLPTEIWNLILCTSGYEWKVPVERVCRLFRSIYGEMEKPKSPVKSYSSRDAEVFSTTFAAWALDNGAKWGEYACKYIVRRGDRELIQWASDNKCPFDNHACGAAARKGDLELLKWLKTTEICRDIKTCFSNAAKGGHLDVINHLIEVPWSCRWDDIELGWGNAETQGHIHVLELMIKREYQDYVATIGWDAAVNGKLDMLKWLHDKELMNREGLDICEGAAESGDLNVLKWCLDNGYAADETMFIGAVISGNIEMLEWLIKGVYPWDARVFFYAALHGHMKVLEMLRNNDAPWDAHTRTGAYIGNHIKVLEWLKENEYPWSVNAEMNALKGCEKSYAKANKRMLNMRLNY